MKGCGDRNTYSPKKNGFYINFLDLVFRVEVDYSFSVEVYKAFLSTRSPKVQLEIKTLPALITTAKEERQEIN